MLSAEIITLCNLQRHARHFWLSALPEYFENCRVVVVVLWSISIQISAMPSLPHPVSMSTL